MEISVGAGCLGPTRYQYRGPRVEELSEMHCIKLMTYTVAGDGGYSDTSPI